MTEIILQKIAEPIFTKVQLADLKRKIRLAIAAESGLFVKDSDILIYITQSGGTQDWKRMHIMALALCVQLSKMEFHIDVMQHEDKRNGLRYNSEVTITRKE